MYEKADSACRVRMSRAHGLRKKAFRQFSIRSRPAHRPSAARGYQYAGIAHACAQMNADASPAEVGQASTHASGGRSAKQLLAPTLWVIMIRRFTLALIVLVAGCAGTSEQISSELTRSGLDARQSRCIGDRLAADLSVGELRQLGRAARVYQEASKTRRADSR